MNKSAIDRSGYSTQCFLLECSFCLRDGGVDVSANGEYSEA